MAPPKDIARSYPKRGITADIGFRSEPKFCGDGSIQLNGSDQYLNAELSSALGDSFTIMGWAKREDTSPTLDYIVNAGGLGSAGDAISISITNADPGVLYFFDNTTSVNTSNTVEFNEWFHFALTVAPGAGNVKLYKNGIDGTPSNTVAVNLSDVTFEVGRYLGNSHYFPGKIFDLRVYDETLTQDQIRELLNNPGQTVPTGLTSADLIHRYLFETNANDTGATGNNLTANNSPTFGVDRAQLPRGLDLVRGAAMARVHTGRAVDFDGSADVLGGEKYEGGTTKATFCVWFNADTLPASQHIFSNALATGLDSKAQIYLQSTNNTLRVDDTADMVAFEGVETEQWHFVAGVYDSTNGVEKAYLNGVIGGSPASYGAGNTTTKFVIGARAQNAQQPFNGKISNFKIFNVELSQDQVRELYHNPEQVLPTGVSASNLRRHYPLSDYNDAGGTGGRYFQDMGADGEPVEDLGSASMAFAQPVPCPQLGLQQSAMRFFFTGSGAQSYKATVTAPGTTATLSGWIFWGDSSRISYLVAIGQVLNGTDSLNIRINTAGDITMYKGAEYDSGLNINEGEWNHIVVTTKSSSPYWRCWLNGVEASSPAVAPATNISTGNVYPGSNDTPYPLNGFINDVAFWDAELDTSDVAALYNSGVQGMDVSTVQSSSLKGWWKADDFEAFKDYSGNGANAVQTGGSGTIIGASFPENASGSTLVGDFSLKRKGVSVLNLPAVVNGADEYALSPKDPAFLPSFANGGSFSCFFRVQKLGEYSIIFINDDYGSGTQHRYAAYVNNSDKMVFELGDSSSAKATPTSTATISDSDWHHFAYTVDYGGGSTTTIKLFIDGVLDSTSTATTLAGVPNATQLRFGDYLTLQSNEAQGPIACLKFYQVTLSDNEIKQIYNSDLRLIKGLANE